MILILACWQCKDCDTQGRDIEPVVCWNCDKPPFVTARITVDAA